jgi:hypothetical protein
MALNVSREGASAIVVKNITFPTDQSPNISEQKWQ